MTRAAWLSLGLCLATGCTDVTTELVRARPADSGLRPDAAGEEPRCGRGGCACDNGSDDDDDELIDGLDPECTGPFDDDESSFATGIPGGALDFCQDCYWDDNATADDDGCVYNTDCLFGEAPSTAAPGCAQCDVSAQCASTCGDRTPNGCDCFGCCAVIDTNETLHVLLSDSCSLRDVANEEKCLPCVQSTECVNPCGTCEICPGRKRRDLPPECRGMGMTTDDPMNVCEEGQQVCSEDLPCPTDHYCQLGCCLFIPQ